MTPAEAKRRACSLAGVHLDITREQIRTNKRYPTDPKDQKRVEKAIDEIITELRRRGD